LPRELAIRPFSYAEAREQGIGEGRLRGPDLARPFHGTRMEAAQTSELEARCAAYLLVLPPSAFFNSITAAILIGIPVPRAAAASDLLHVAVVAPVRAPKGRGVVGHKVQLMGDDTCELRGLPVSSPVRTWLELSTVLTLPQLVAAGDHLVHWRAPVTRPDILKAAIARYPGRRGRPLLRAAVELLDERAESPMESELRVGLIGVGISGLVSNHPVRVGNARYRIDLALPEWKIAIEYQGDYHRDREQWKRDMTRISRLESVDWAVIQVNSDDVRTVDELAHRIRRLVGRRRKRA
jgi:very-short-patch-repair endonuclease